MAPNSNDPLFCHTRSRAARKARLQRRPAERGRKIRPPLSQRRSLKTSEANASNIDSSWLGAIRCDLSIHFAVQDLAQAPR